MNETPKEKIYDEQISGKMAEIIELCQKHKIGLVASFDLGLQPGTEGDPQPYHVGSTTLLAKGITPGGSTWQLAMMLQQSMDTGKLEHLSDRERPGYIMGGDK